MLSHGCVSTVHKSFGLKAFLYIYVHADKHEKRNKHKQIKKTKVFLRSVEDDKQSGIGFNVSLVACDAARTSGSAHTQVVNFAEFLLITLCKHWHETPSTIQNIQAQRSARPAKLILDGFNSKCTINYLRKV